MRYPFFTLTVFKQIKSFLCLSLNLSTDPALLRGCQRIGFWHDSALPLSICSQETVKQTERKDFIARPPWPNAFHTQRAIFGQVEPCTKSTSTTLCFINCHSSSKQTNWTYSDMMVCSMHLIPNPYQNLCSPYHHQIYYMEKTVLDHDLFLKTKYLSKHLDTERRDQC